jgi:hypothetical protein
MRYMLQVRFNDATAAIDSLASEEQRSVLAEFEAVRLFPGVLDGNQLQEAETARTVRVVRGVTQVAGGPAVDRGAVLDGYYLCDAPNLDATIALAARIPVARFGGTIEVRPVVER